MELDLHLAIEVDGMCGCVTHHDACQCREEYFRVTVQEWRDKVEAMNLQIREAMEIIQDHCDLLSEQPHDSKRPFIIGARARLEAFIERNNIKTGPEVRHG